MKIIDETIHNYHPSKLRRFDFLQAFVHLSTAFCNPDIDYMEEKVYVTKENPYNIINMVKTLDDESLRRIEER